MPQIPTRDKRFIQNNKGDVFGNLWATFNLDFDSNKGRVRVSQRTRINTDSVDDSDLGLPTAFLRSSADNTDRWWALCGTTLFKTSGTNPSAAFTQDAIANSPTNATITASDMIEFNEKLYVSLNTNIAELDSGTWDVDWWTTIPSGTALTTGIPHPLHATKKTNTFLAGDGNLIHAMDLNENVSNSRLIFPAEYEVTWIQSSQVGTWIGLRHKTQGEAVVAFWDESAENYNRLYGVKSDRTFAGTIKDGLLYLINSKGQVLRYSGVGFDEVATLPIFYTFDTNLDIDAIHRNGMAVIDEEIHILINNTKGASGRTAELQEQMPSGIWVLSDDGLRHKYPISTYDGTVNEYGTIMNLFGLTGALVSTSEIDGLFLAGAAINNDIFDTNNILKVILYRSDDFSASTGADNRGYFITSTFESSGFEDVFTELLVSFRRFIKSGDRIIIKYRTTKNPNYPIFNNQKATWSDTDTFTTDMNLSLATVGNEVMITNGKGSGTTAHISAISLNGSTYTVDLDETIPNVAGEFAFVINDWLKCATISTQSIDRQGFDLDAVGTFIQLKVEMRTAAGSQIGVELEKIIINSIPEAAI